VKNLAFCDPVCERAREYASLRLDNELSELEEALLAAHLSRCETCSAFAKGIEVTTGELRAAALEQPSVPVVIARRRRRAGVQVLRVGSAAAVVAVALFAGVVETVLKPGGVAVSATPSASMLVAPGSEVKELRALNRDRLRPAVRVSPNELRTLRLPGDS
jgi:predicted anti-sigma-YlaC factor YlaD